VTVLHGMKNGLAYDFLDQIVFLQKFWFELRFEVAMESCESQSVIFEIYVSGTLTTQRHSSTHVSFDRDKQSEPVIMLLGYATVPTL